jgi:hypothetical protein
LAAVTKPAATAKTLIGNPDAGRETEQKKPLTYSGKHKTLDWDSETR